MPNVRGLMRDEAVVLLEEAGLAVAPVIFVHHWRTAGTVMEQSPSYGDNVPRGTVVILNASAGPVPTIPRPVLTTEAVGSSLFPSLNASSRSITDEILVELIRIGSITNDYSVLLLEENFITDLSPLKFMTNLETLRLHGNPLTHAMVNELRAALPNTTITFGVFYNINSASVTNEEFARMVQDGTVPFNVTDLWISYATPISDISPIAQLTELVSFTMYYTKIVDFSPLLGLPHLAYLNLGDGCENCIDARDFDGVECVLSR
jgi:hypothetical protein